MLTSANFAKPASHAAQSRCARLEAYRSQDALYAKPNCRRPYWQRERSNRLLQKRNKAKVFCFFGRHWGNANWR